MGCSEFHLRIKIKGILISYISLPENTELQQIFISYLIKNNLLYLRACINWKLLTSDSDIDTFLLHN